MLVNNYFDKSYCLVYENNTNVKHCLSNMGFTVDYLYSSHSDSFLKHIDFFENALISNYSHIIVFRDNIVSNNIFNDSFDDFFFDIVNLNVDLVILSTDVFYHPTSGAIIYNRSAFKKILAEYRDFIEIMDYELYLLKYANLTFHTAKPSLFYTDTALQRLLLNHDVYNFFSKYYLLFIFCIFSFCIKKYIKNSVINDIGRRRKVIT